MRTTMRTLSIIICLLCVGFVSVRAQIISNGIGGGDWNAPTTWVDGIIPSALDNVIIASSDSVYILSTSASVSCNNLTVNGKMTDALSANTFTVSGTLTLGANSFFFISGSHLVPGSSYSFATTSTVAYLLASGTSITYPPAPGYGNLYFAGGATTLLSNLIVANDLTIAGGAKLKGCGTAGTYTHSIGRDVIITSTGSPALDCLDNATAFTASCTWSIGRDLTMTSAGRISGFASSGVSTGSIGVITVGRNLTITNGQLQYGTNAANASNFTLNVGGDLTVASTAIWVKQSGAAPGTWTVNFNGTSGTQHFSAPWGNPQKSSGVTCTLKVSNPNGLILNQPLTLTQNWLLYLLNGPIYTSSTTLLTDSTSAGADIVSGSSSGYVIGPMGRYIASTSAATKIFPIGKGSDFRPLSLHITQAATTTTQYVAELFNSAPTNRTLPGTLDKVSNAHYYHLTESAGGSAITSADININYSNNDTVNDVSHLRIAKDDGAGNWVDLGGTGTASPEGSINSTNNFTSFSDFVLANATGGSNFIPPPEITITSSLSPFFTGVGTPSASQSFTFSGVHVRNSLTVTAPSGFEISGSSNGSFTTSPLVIFHSDGIIPPTTLYIRLSGATAGTYSDNITFVSSGATTQYIAVSGIVAPTFTLNVSALNGTIVKNPDKLAYDSASTVQLTATPATGYLFTGWSGDILGIENPVQVTMNADKNITANFAIMTYALTVNAVHGTVTKNPEQVSYDSASTVQVHATPEEGYHFVGWSGDLTGSENPANVTMYSNKNITANFELTVLTTFTLTIESANGLVVKNPDHAVYDSASTVQLTATPATGYQFTGWSGGVTGSTNPISVTMDANKAVTANFTIKKYTITVASTNGNIDVSPYAASYDSGAVVQITAQPSIGYHFESWSGEDAPAGHEWENPIFVTIVKDMSISTDFELNDYLISTTAIGNGSINPSNPYVSFGFSQVLTIHAATGYHIDSVLVDGVNEGVISTYTFSDVSMTHAVIAYFSIYKYPLVILATNGTVSKNPDQSLYDSASTVQLAALPATGYSFKNWTGNVPAGHELDNPLSLMMVESKTLTANFAVKTYTLSTSVYPPSSGWMMPPVPDLPAYDSAAVVRLDAMANPDTHFGGWSGDVPAGHELDMPLMLTMNSNKTVTANFVSNAVTVPISINTGWNLISVPLIQTDYSASTIFPGKFGDMFAFDPESGYSPILTLSIGSGYWAYYTTAQNVNITGTISGPIYVHCKRGWNCIGSREVPVPTTSLTTIPPNQIFGDIFIYDGGGYIPTLIIMPGYGAYVYVLSDCIVVIP